MTTVIFFKLGRNHQLATLSLSTSLDVANKHIDWTMLHTKSEKHHHVKQRYLLFGKQIQGTLILDLYTFSDFQCLSRDSHIFFLENLGRSSVGGFL